jgi:CheY-like chemotaxis protein
MKPRILLVDDDPEFARLIEYNLESVGCEILIAPNGLEGLRLARTELPDLILLDLMLPDLGGISVCEILRIQPSTRDIPIFILTALADSCLTGKRTHAACGLLVKPVDLKLLTEAFPSSNNSNR